MHKFGIFYLSILPIDNEAKMWYTIMLRGFGAPQSHARRQKMSIGKNKQKIVTEFVHSAT